MNLKTRPFSTAGQITAITAFPDFHFEPPHVGCYEISACIARFSTTPRPAPPKPSARMRYRTVGGSKTPLE
ncbi:hypothetical protein GC207_06980 [bacterium]|nr:hypothetical protein [bacterium]